MRNSSLEISMDNPNMDKLQYEGEDLFNQSAGVDPSLSGAAHCDEISPVWKLQFI